LSHFVPFLDHPLFLIVRHAAPVNKKDRWDLGDNWIWNR
jgi:hypothetical protein